MRVADGEEMTENQPSLRDKGRAMAFDSKYVEKSASGGKTSNFKPVKPANISRPQNVKVPPPPKYSNGRD